MASIQRFAQITQAFDPEANRVLGQAFDMACCLLRQRARRIARLLSCGATDHSHSLIEGGGPSLRNLPSPPLTRLREGTDKSFLKWG